MFLDKFVFRLVEVDGELCEQEKPVTITFWSSGKIEKTDGGKTEKPSRAEVLPLLQKVGAYYGIGIEGPRPAPAVQAGQVWVDNDKRSAGRTLEVMSIEGDRANCKVLTLPGRAIPISGKWVKIKLRRFKPVANGYRLEKEAVKP